MTMTPGMVVRSPSIKARNWSSTSFDERRSAALISWAGRSVEDMSQLSNVPGHPLPAPGVWKCRGLGKDGCWRVS